MFTNAANKTDKQGYDQQYRDQESPLARISNKDNYIKRFEKRVLTPYHLGGRFVGTRRGIVTSMLFQAIEELGKKHSDINILDAGCGLGLLSAYLACKGFNVTGVDISAEGCAKAAKLTENLGMSDHCTFYAQSLDNTTIEDSSLDFIIGHATLHHFIKYDRVPKEFRRIMKPHAKGFFVDPFGENLLYHVFHDKKKMEKLGDVILTKGLIIDSFKEFDLELVPTDWFAMLDKLVLRVLPRRGKNWAPSLSKMFYSLDRKIPTSSRVALFLSGSVITVIGNRKGHNRK